MMERNPNICLLCEKALEPHSSSFISNCPLCKVKICYYNKFVYIEFKNFDFSVFYYPKEHKVSFFNEFNQEIVYININKLSLNKLIKIYKIYKLI